jgi:hypothetical protein
MMQGKFNIVVGVPCVFFFVSCCLWLKIDLPVSCTMHGCIIRPWHAAADSCLWLLPDAMHLESICERQQEYKAVEIHCCANQFSTANKPNAQL